MTIIEGQYIHIFGLTIHPPKGFEIGSLSIYMYGLIIAFGMLLAVIYGCKRCKQFGISVDDLTDGVLCIVPFAIICARAYYCIFEWSAFKDDPVSVLYIWEGGLAIYGGVIGAVIGILVFCKFKKIKASALLDLALLGFLIGQAIGRWGNFFNREAYGSEISETLFWAMGLSTTGADGSWAWHHPTFLYESLWNAAGFVLLHYLSKKRHYDGQIALGYAAWYGLGRTFIEGLRTDSLWWGSLRVSQILAAGSCFIAVGVLLYMAFQKHDPAKMQVNLTAARENAQAAKTEEASGMEPLILTDDRPAEEPAEETEEEIEEAPVAPIAQEAEMEPIGQAPTETEETEETE